MTADRFGDRSQEGRKAGARAGIYLDTGGRQQLPGNCEEKESRGLPPPATNNHNFERLFRVRCGELLRSGAGQWRPTDSRLQLRPLSWSGRRGKSLSASAKERMSVSTHIPHSTAQPKSCNAAAHPRHRTARGGQSIGGGAPPNRWPASSRWVIPIH